MRLDQYLARSGLCESRQKSRDLILMGSVLVNGKPVTKPAFLLRPDDVVEIREFFPYVSRAALKLLHAIRFFGIEVQGRVCVDVGASTGGFTQVLLENGASLVYAIDVGHDQLHSRLREDPRVVNLEGTNFKFVDRDMLKGNPNFLSMDVSFVAASSLLGKVSENLTPPWDAVVLVKPQFEMGRPVKRGVVKKREDHATVLMNFIERCKEANICVSGLVHSPILGREGNIEYLAHLRSSGEWFSGHVEWVVDHAFEDLLS